MSGEKEPVRYEFEDYSLDPARLELRRGGERLHVEPQVFQVLLHLVRHRDRVVPRTELLDSVWGDRFVSDSALASRVKAARRAVGDNGTSQRVIRTMFGRGYQLVAPVREVRDAVSVPQSEPVMWPQQGIRFCTSRDGVRLAHALTGSGPVLVQAARGMTSLDEGAPGHWLPRLSERHTLVRYDARGCGLSDREVGRFSLDDWVDDLLAVVDALGLERFPLLGVSEGAAVAVAFAGRHPERVGGLVLHGAFARGRMARATTQREKELAAFDLDLARMGWEHDEPGLRQVFTARMLPRASREEWERFDEARRLAVEPETAVHIVNLFAHVDIRAEAAAVRCPVLVVHARDDRAVPLAAGLELANLLRGSTFVAMPGDSHLLADDDPAWPVFSGELDAFLGVAGRQANFDRGGAVAGSATRSMTSRPLSAQARATGHDSSAARASAVQSMPEPSGR
ncbi:alpha/beta fold hydrolase [Lentzea fradiae]|uniref:alpha/beta fold hydrolase n=1 Tax=Lentzea fradiae TaxID=200378 RepID=UPI001FE0B9BF|nr:alpha/beta fold hydrolase [Lentzea fradiae]